MDRDALPSDHFLGIEVEHQRFPCIVLLRRQAQWAATRVQYRAPRALGRGPEEGISCHSPPVLHLGSAHGDLRLHLDEKMADPIIRKSYEAFRGDDGCRKCYLAGAP